MSFDPVTEADAYRHSLLTALGDQDPAVVLAAGPAVMECLAHLADSELVTAGRLRWIASEERALDVARDARVG